MVVIRYISDPRSEDVESSVEGTESLLIIGKGTDAIGKDTVLFKLSDTLPSNDAICKGVNIKEAVNKNNEKILICDEMNPKKIKNFWKGIDFKWIILKTIDFENENSSYAGHISNLYGISGSNGYNISNLVKKFINMGVPSEKLVISIPFYSRVYYDTVGLGMEFSKTEIVFSLPENINSYFDDIAIGAYSYDSNKKELYCHESMQTIKKKMEYIKENKLGGICYFSPKITPEIKTYIEMICETPLAKEEKKVEEFNVSIEFDTDTGVITGTIVLDTVSSIDTVCKGILPSTDAVCKGTFGQIG